MITAAKWDRLTLRLMMNSDGKRRHWPDKESAQAELQKEDPKGFFHFFEVEQIELGAYWNALDRADWYYSMADDSDAYSRGAAEIGELERQTLCSPEHATMFEAFQRHYEAPVAVRDETNPKPDRPVTGVLS